MTSSRAGNEAIEALRRIVAEMPGAEERQGQIDMVHAVASAVDAGRSVIVQAGTGTGKSLGYLVPAILCGKKTVVATATKALQDQLNRNDLPLVASHIGRDVSWAVVKGRANYVCMQRVDELTARGAQLDIEEISGRLRGEIDEIAAWARRSEPSPNRIMRSRHSDFTDFTDLTHRSAIAFLLGAWNVTAR